MTTNYKDNLEKIHYKDPDSFPDLIEKYDSVFYENYCRLLNDHLKFLLKSETEIDKETIKSITFKCHKEKEIYNKNHMGIFMFAGKKVFQLKSDQFGFSANVKQNIVYPYQAYFDLMIKNKKEEEATDKIFGEDGWIQETRKPGGSFLWPIEDGDTNFNPKYNQKRGGHCGSKKDYYIQDRVDLTLYEIKEVFEGIIGKINTENILCNYLYTSRMFEFLNVFGTFETFVKVFGFDGNFVRKVGKEWEIVNIFVTKIEDISDSKKIKYIDDNYISEARNGKKLFKADTKYSEYENMFDVVCKLIEERRKNLSLE